MRYIRLGRSGLQVSRLALGTMNFGPLTDEATSHRILDAAVDGGINLVDTADVYGADANRQVYGLEPDKGRTEEIIGTWLAKTPARRDQIVLATKAYGAMGPGVNDIRLSARRIRRACEESLRRLRTDHLDLYLLHHVDRTTPWEEIWEALSLLRQQGKVLYFGTSNHAAWHIVRGQCVAERLGAFGFVAEQSIYNLMQRSVELEVLPACQDLGLGFLPYSPLHGGLLGGILRKEQAERGKTGRAAAGLAAGRDRVERYEQACDAFGEHPAVVALAWLLHQPGVTAPIVGARTLDQLSLAQRALEVELDADQLALLDEIFPGPGGPAPEAYAW
ncbi:aldo/keto reductase [Thermoactinospora rubra]|uniref:aldo/keto reductase n=1 Tax=Thermoactinospora rubra TaxID=1088767 RepID=UPI000A115823|nr:aldo/keto reductase [Thermoactinospora rubra]